MSADAAKINCPICNHFGVFHSTEDLRNRLITVSTSAIKCPVCQEEVIGLDKLTIHLFSHVQIYKTENSNIESVNMNKNKVAHESVKSNNSVSKNKLSAPVCTPVKYVKIFPKLPVVAVNTMPAIEVSKAKLGDPLQITSQIRVPNSKSESFQLLSDTLCNICGLQFVDKNILKMHRCLIHNIEEKEEPNIIRYQCHMCSKNFKMRGSLMVHMRVAHFGFPQSCCNLKSNKNMLSDELSNDLNDKCISFIKTDNKQWQCDVCHKYFTTKYFLKKHKRLHTGETPYSCAQCNKTFTFQQSYHKHLLYHNDEKPHVCNFCGRAFKELSTLHNHQRIHTGEKPFTCEACGKSFRQRVSYLVHKRIHTGVMPYKCTACDKSFRYKVSQRTHKCPAQPPGNVVRQAGNLIEKLKLKQNEILSLQNTKKENCIIDSNVSDARELITDGAQLSLENTETENLSLIAKAFKHQEPYDNNNIEDLLDTNLEELIDSLPPSEKNVPSPSEILKNLCLSQEDDIVCSSSNDEHVKSRDFFEYMQ